MTLAAPEAVPPMVFALAPFVRATPLSLPIAAVPLESVPIKLPTTTLPLVPLKWMPSSLKCWTTSPCTSLPLEPATKSSPSAPLMMLAPLMTISGGPL